jgi:DNA-binding transcriptional MerR regulator
MFGNPIFRDTYMYSDLYPQYKNVDICVRRTNVLKRLRDNYYTVEKLREFYDKDNKNKENNITKKIIDNNQRKITNKVKKIMKNVSSENKALEILDILKNRFEGKIINELEMDNVYTLELATLFNKMDLKKIKELFNNDTVVEIATNKKIKKTIISFWQEIEKDKNI